MSAPGFRAALLARLAANWTATPIFDLSDYVAFADIPQGDADALLLVQFIGGPINAATIGGPGSIDWREQGIAILHLAMPAGESSARALDYGGQLWALLIGQRLGDFTIDSMENFSDFAGAAIKLDGRWHGWSANLGYTSNVCA
jgi:hypothetical protein